MLPVLAALLLAHVPLTPLTFADGEMHCAQGTYETRLMMDDGKPSKVTFASGHAQLCYTVSKDKKTASYRVTIIDVENGNPDAPPGVLTSMDLAEPQLTVLGELSEYSWAAETVDYTEKVPTKGLAQALHIGTGPLGFAAAVVIRNNDKSAMTIIVASFMQIKKPQGHPLHPKNVPNHYT
jgi:hypothetical protein